MIERGQSFRVCVNWWLINIQRYSTTVAKIYQQWSLVKTLERNQPSQSLHDSNWCHWGTTLCTTTTFCCAKKGQMSLRWRPFCLKTDARTQVVSASGCKNGQGKVVYPRIHFLVSSDPCSLSSVFRTGVPSTVCSQNEQVHLSHLHLHLAGWGPEMMGCNGFLKQFTSYRWSNRLSPLWPHSSHQDQWCSPRTLAITVMVDTAVKKNNPNIGLKCLVYYNNRHWAR